MLTDINNIIATCYDHPIQWRELTVEGSVLAVLKTVVEWQKCALWFGHYRNRIGNVFNGYLVCLHPVLISAKIILSG